MSSIPDPVSQNDQDIAELLKRMHQGDSDAAWKIALSHEGYLRKIAVEEMHIGIQANVGGSDVVQESIMQAKKDLPRFRGTSPAQLKAWLRKLLRNKIVDAVRRIPKKRAVRNGDPVLSYMPDPGSSPSVHLQRMELNRLIADEIAKLPDVQRAVLILRSREGRKFSDIGAILGITAESARKIWTRTIDRLRVIFKATKR